MTRRYGTLPRRPARRATAAGPIAATAALAVAALGALAAPESKEVPLSKIERKNLAPVSNEVLRVRLPKPVETSLDNGLAVLILEDHRFPTVQLQLQIAGAGPIEEPAGRPGLALLTARMLTEGAAGRTGEQLAREIEQAGAGISAAAPFGSTDTSLTAAGLSDNLERWLALVADVLLRPEFPADAFDKLKLRMKAQLRQQRASPHFLAHEQFSRAVYGGHPAAVVSTTEAALDALTPDRLAAWHRERYVPQRAVLGVAGDVRADDLIPRLERLLGGWRPRGGPASPPPAPAALKTRRLVVVERPASVQTRLVLGGLAIDRRDPDYIPVMVMNRIFGGGSASRLFLNLREEKGYTYGVYSHITALKYPGTWRAFGDVRTEVTGPALEEFVKEIRLIREQPVEAPELKDAQRSMVASFALSLEKPAQVLGYALTRKIYGLPEDYWDRYPSRVMAVTPEEVRRVAVKYIAPETMQVVAVGDAATLKPALATLGPVEVFGTDGKPVK